MHYVTCDVFSQALRATRLLYQVRFNRLVTGVPYPSVQAVLASFSNMVINLYVLQTLRVAVTFPLLGVDSRTSPQAFRKHKGESRPERSRIQKAAATFNKQKLKTPRRHSSTARPNSKKAAPDSKNSSATFRKQNVQIQKRTGSSKQTCWIGFKNSSARDRKQDVGKSNLTASPRKQRSRI